MSDLRALIRELLSEEIAALRAELAGGVQVERVRVASSEDLTQFALSVVRRVQEPGFVAALSEGRIRFEPEPGSVSVAVAPPTCPPVGTPATAPIQTLVTTVPAGVPELRKTLVTERDIMALTEGATRLRIVKSARLTPLAGDEARRRGIRIERTLS